MISTHLLTVLITGGIHKSDDENSTFERREAL